MQPDSMQVSSDVPRVWAVPGACTVLLHWLLSVTLEGASHSQVRSLEFMGRLSPSYTGGLPTR